jgi:hypothetical protein
MRNVLITLVTRVVLFAAYLYARNLCMDRLTEAAWSNYDEMVGELTDEDVPRMIENMVGGQIDTMVIEQCKDPALILRALREDLRREP